MDEIINTGMADGCICDVHLEAIFDRNIIPVMSGFLLLHESLI